MMKLKVSSSTDGYRDHYGEEGSPQEVSLVEYSDYPLFIFDN